MINTHTNKSVPMNELFVNGAIVRHTSTDGLVNVTLPPKNGVGPISFVGRVEAEDRECTYFVEGYNSRRGYLAQLADDYGIDAQVVLNLADLYGPNEDFDGLATALEDMVSE